MSPDRLQQLDAAFQGVEHKPPPEWVDRFLTPEVLLDQVRKNVAWVETCLADADHDAWTPHLWIQAWDYDKADEQVIVSALVVPFNTLEEKQRALASVAAKVYAGRMIPLNVVLTSQVWMSKDPQGIQPILDPNRREGIIAAGMSLRKLFAMAKAEVTITAGKIQPVKFCEPHTQGGFPSLGYFWQGFALAALNGKAAR